ncbi:unnamed protein product, partial [Haemonchus placei]|uniref:Transmembrane protein n=1 Tax=Haemonchus placei TaxID=6290 RepID=A0A0N4W049_HAEPC
MRVPLAGLVTGWMATLPVGRYITALYMLSFYLLYLVMYSATVLATIRAIVICSSNGGDEMVKRLLPVFFLAIYLLPILTTWFLYPAVTYIRMDSRVLPGYGATFDYVKVYPN